MEYAHRFAGAYDLAWWVAAEQAELIGDQFTALGAELGYADPAMGADLVRSAVLGGAGRVAGPGPVPADLRQCRARGGCGGVAAERAADVAGWLPGGGGHVLITTREHGWDEIAAPVEIDVLARPESIAFLQHTQATASHLAWALRDLGRYADARDLGQDTLARNGALSARTTPTPCSPPTASPRSCAPWVTTRPPATCTRTPWTGAATSSARTTPTLWPPPTASPKDLRVLGESGDRRRRTHRRGNPPSASRRRQREDR